MKPGRASKIAALRTFVDNMSERAPQSSIVLLGSANKAQTVAKRRTRSLTGAQQGENIFLSKHRKTHSLDRHEPVRVHAQSPGCAPNLEISELSKRTLLRMTKRHFEKRTCCADGNRQLLLTHRDLQVGCGRGKRATCLASPRCLLRDIRKRKRPG